MLPNNQLNLRQSNRSIYLKILFFLLIFHFFSSTLISCLFHLFFNSLFTSFHLLLYRSLPQTHAHTTSISFIHLFSILNALFLSSSTTPRGTLMFYFSNLLFFVSFLFQLFFLLPPLSLLPQTIFLYFSHHITLCSNLLITLLLSAIRQHSANTLALKLHWTPTLNDTYLTYPM